MRILKLSLFCSLIALSSAFAQYNWVNQGDFPPAPYLLYGNLGGHGVAVDPDGKIWIAPYRPYQQETVYVPEENMYYNACPVYVYYPDGTPVPFSPIKIVNTAEKKNKVLQFQKTGIAVDNNGNILVNDYNELIRINYKTGEGMNWAHFSTDGNSSICKPAIDMNGNIFIAFVWPGYPVLKLNLDFTINSIAVNSVSGFGRTLEVSPNGKIIYAPRYTDLTVYRYLQKGRTGQFELVDNILNGWAIESSSINTQTGLLYLSSGSYNDLPTAPGITPVTWYGVNVRNNQIVDSLKWIMHQQGSASERPRGIAFSPDGMTAYITCFAGSTYPIVQKLTASLQKPAAPEKTDIAAAYELYQNYPNPFNPATVIKYSLEKESFVRLAVYNSLGEKVRELVKGIQNAGLNQAVFNAAELPSGIYVYSLEVRSSDGSKDYRDIKKMMLIK